MTRVRPRYPGAPPPATLTPATTPPAEDSGSTRDGSGGREVAAGGWVAERTDAGAAGGERPASCSGRDKLPRAIIGRQRVACCTRTSICAVMEAGRADAGCGGDASGEPSAVPVRNREEWRRCGVGATETWPPGVMGDSMRITASPVAARIDRPLLGGPSVRADEPAVWAPAPCADALESCAATVNVPGSATIDGAGVGRGGAPTSLVAFDAVWADAVPACRCGMPAGPMVTGTSITNTPSIHCAIRLQAARLSSHGSCSCSRAAAKDRAPGLPPWSPARPRTRGGVRETALPGPPPPPLDVTALPLGAAGDAAAVALAAVTSAAALPRNGEEPPTAGTICTVTLKVRLQVERRVWDRSVVVVAAAAATSSLPSRTVRTLDHTREPAPPPPRGERDVHACRAPRPPTSSPS